MGVNFLSVLEDQKEILVQHDELEILRSMEVKLFYKKATVVTGIRRSGKSTLLRQFCRKDLTSTLYISFFDERLVGVTTKDLNAILEAYSQINSGKSPEFIILDEIQMIDGWEKFVTRLVENPKWKIFITGSSSKLLSKEISSEMRGRSVRYELFPFSFEELLTFKKIDFSKLNTIKKGQLKKQFLEYLTWGGFPETANIKNVDKLKILNEYIEVLLFRDIIERNKFERTGIARRLFVGLIKMYSNPFSINQTHKKLKAEGISLDKNTLSDFIRWCEDAYVFFPVSIYSHSEHISRINPQKLYLSDVGMAQACEVWHDQNIGRRFENLVFLKLRSDINFKSINYYRTEKKHEVDFIFQDSSENIKLIQACWELNEESKNREVRALDEAMGELKIKKSYIITLNQSDTLLVSTGKIRVLNIFEFFLSRKYLFLFEI
jgi:predicted AAA+ superfamily ATPase